MREKSVWRKELMVRRDEIDHQSQMEASERVCARLSKMIRSDLSFPVHLYFAMGKEINLTSLINYLLRHDLQVVSSKSLPDRQLENFIYEPQLPMSPGMFGTQFQADAVIYEGPYSYMIIPGLAFDQNGVRLGYGAGYYDRFLARYPQAVKIGVAYDFQIVDELPREDHDICMNIIVTPNQTIRVSPEDEHQ